MRLQQLMERASLNDADGDIDEMDDAYDELALLSHAFKKKDFGILINKQGRNLDKLDIREIKRKLSNIVRNNIILDGGDFNRGRDGWEKMRLLGRTIGHGLEVTALSALTGALGALTVSSVAIPIVSILAGTATVGGAALVKNQATIIGSLRATSRLLSTLDAFENLKPNYRRSRIKRMLDWVTRKSKRDIEKDVVKQIKIASRKAQHKFEKNMKGFPHYVEYTDSNGDIQEYPTANFFKDL